MHNVIPNETQNSCLKLTGFFFRGNKECSVFSEVIYLKKYYTLLHLTYKSYFT